MDKLKGKLSGGGGLSGKLSGVGALSGKLSAAGGITPDPYTGPTVWTPTGSAQTIPTNGYFMTDDITIDPKPNNYGLITYNGGIITVS